MLRLAAWLHVAVWLQVDVGDMEVQLQPRARGGALPPGAPKAAAPGESVKVGGAGHGACVGHHGG